MSLGAPLQFQSALEALRAMEFRSELVVNEIPSPTHIAPYAVALEAFVIDKFADEEQDLATGKFVLLHTPEGRPEWNGQWRIVTFVRASIDQEMADDPLVASVAWTWLTDALENHDATYQLAGGTATRVLSESFGELETRDEGVDIELRASWSPLGNEMKGHFTAWTEMLCNFAGLPPLPGNVTALPSSRLRTASPAHP